MKRLPTVIVNENILWSKDAALRQKCRAINLEDLEDLQFAQNLIQEMFRTLYEDASGVALAAPQVGVLVRVVTIDFEDRDTNKRILYALINPEIVSSSEETNSDTEICLSVPNFAQEVIRANSVIVKAYDPQGKPLKIIADGFLAKVFQHEIDHLDGILYVDRVEEKPLEVPDWPERRLPGTLKKRKLN